jgi:hypothetical protein
MCRRLRGIDDDGRIGRIRLAMVLWMYAVIDVVVVI